MTLQNSSAPQTTIPAELTLQQLLRHIYHLKRKIKALSKEQRRLTANLKRLIFRARSPLYLFTTQAALAKSRL